MRVDKLYLSVFLFVSLYSIINIIQPNAIYNHQQNSLRPFGVGYKNTTILSLWFVSILLAILSYFVVIYYFNIMNMWFWIERKITFYLTGKADIYFLKWLFASQYNKIRKYRDDNFCLLDRNYSNALMKLVDNKYYILQKM